MNRDFWFKVMVIGYTLIALFLAGVCFYVLFIYGDKPQSKPQLIQTLNGGHIESTLAYPDQGRYYVMVKGDHGEKETWEVSKGYFEKVILGAPINRRDKTW